VIAMPRKGYANKHILKKKLGQIETDKKGKVKKNNDEIGCVWPKFLNM
jgi:hypothetical protein